MASKPMSNVQNFFVPAIEFNEIFAGLLRVWNYTREKGISHKNGKQQIKLNIDSIEVEHLFIFRTHRK